jgi:hypothetical protein
VCSTNIFWQHNEDQGGWWIHQHHPQDGHDAQMDLEMAIATLTTPVAEPQYKTAVIVIEMDPARLPEAVQSVQRFLLGADHFPPLRGEKLFGPTLHVAVEDVAEAVLAHFETAPMLEGKDL